jgi:hypothetical protein
MKRGRTKSVVDVKVEATASAATPAAVVDPALGVDLALKAEVEGGDTAWVTPTLAAPLCRVEINPAPSSAELNYKNERPDIVLKDCLIIKSLYVEPEAHMEGPSAQIYGVNVTVTRVSDDRFLVVATSPFFVYAANSTISIYPMAVTIPSTLPAWISTALMIVGPPGRVGWTYIACSNARSLGPAGTESSATRVTIAAACLARSVAIDTDMTNVTVVGDAALSLCSVRASGACRVKMQHLVSGTLLVSLSLSAEFKCKHGRVAHAVANLSHECRAELPHIAASIGYAISRASILIAASVPAKYLQRSSTEQRRVKLNTTAAAYEYLEE